MNKDPQKINDIIVDKMFVIYANDSFMTTKINYDQNDLTVILIASRGIIQHPLPLLHSTDREFSQLSSRGQKPYKPFCETF